MVRVIRDRYPCHGTRGTGSHLRLIGRIMDESGSMLKREAGCLGSDVVYAPQSIRYRLRRPGGGAIRPRVTC